MQNLLQQLSKVWLWSNLNKRSEGWCITIYSWILSNGSDWDRIGLSYFGVTWRHNLKTDLPFGNVFLYYSGVRKYQTCPPKKKNPNKTPPKLKGVSGYSSDKIFRVCQFSCLFPHVTFGWRIIKIKPKKCQERNMDSITLLLRTMFALK